MSLVTLLAVVACAQRPAPLAPDPPPAVESPSVALTLHLDAPELVARASTIRCITQPCPSNAAPAVAEAAIVLENHGTRPVTVGPSSGPRYAVALLDAKGRVLREWGDEVGAAPAPGPVTLDPGARERWTATLRLVDPEGAELAGRFVVRVSLVGTDLLAEAPVTVRLEGAPL